MQEIIDNLIAIDRFKMKSLYDNVWSIFEKDGMTRDNTCILRDNLSNKKYKQLAYGIFRHTFLIELVKLPDIGTTKFQTRCGGKFIPTQFILLSGEFV